MEKELANFGVQDAWEVFGLFRIWERSQYTTLPKGGGWLDQEAYIQRGFEALLKRKSLHEMKAYLKEEEKQQNKKTAR